MATKDYSSIYSIKDFCINVLAPKYFNMQTVNTNNIGMIGYTTDIAANMSEDVYNAISTYIREIFPNTAQIPETLYNEAALFQIEDLFAVPAEMDAIIFIDQDDIINLGTPNGSLIQFVIDSDLILDVEGKQFMLDYNIIISAKLSRGSYVFTASYDTSFSNDLSNVTNPYIKIRQVKMNSKTYLGLIVTMRQVVKTPQVEYIISNDKINLPKLTLNFTDQLAGFEAFYKAPGDTNYTQLKKLMFNSVPIKDPFCYFRIKDETTLEVSFTLRDGFFQPAFNSEILFNIYTTTGKAGNFPKYQGSNITVIPKSSVYGYNNNLIMFGICQNQSKNGRDNLTLEELRSLVIERYSTSGAYNTESDLQIFFSNNNALNNTSILFIKKRDDALERLFSSFVKIIDPNGDVYPTNTVNMQLFESDFDQMLEQSSRFLLKPGHIFRFIDNKLDVVENITNKRLTDDLTVLSDEFLYTNPFLIVVAKSPGIVGFYLNSLDDTLSLDYSYVNNNSEVQFIASSVTAKRNALLGEDYYTFDITLLPTNDDGVKIVDTNNNDLGNLVVKGFIEDLGVEVVYFDFVLKSVDTKNNLYTYEAKVYTDDYLNLSQHMQILDVKDTTTGEVLDTKLVPMNDCKINFYAFYKYSDQKLSHKYDYLTELQPYSLTNIYSADDTRVNFITPINMMRSTMTLFTYQPNNGTTPTTPTTPDDSVTPTTPSDLNLGYYMNLSFIPLVKANTMKDPTLYSAFLSELYSQYNYLEDTVAHLTTENFGIDIKFYNTYGRARSFQVGENGQLLDRVNCSITYKVALKIGVDEASAIRDLKLFIKDYTENVNQSKGYNAIYISNMIQAIENNFQSQILYMKFIKINNYDSSIQVIQNKAGADLTILTKDERKAYVPEYLTMTLDDIDIQILTT